MWENMYENVLGPIIEKVCKESMANPANEVKIIAESTDIAISVKAMLPSMA